QRKSRSDAVPAAPPRAPTQILGRRGIAHLPTGIEVTGGWDDTFGYACAERFQPGHLLPDRMEADERDTVQCRFIQPRIQLDLVAFNPRCSLPLQQPAGRPGFNRLAVHALFPPAACCFFLRHSLVRTPERHRPWPAGLGTYNSPVRLPECPI